MITVFFRTIVIYAVLLISVRIMGKRQLGELELSELITTLMVSELAVLPISDKRIPVLYGIVPILVLLSVEVIFIADNHRFARSQADLLRHSGDPHTRRQNRRKSPSPREDRGR